MKLKRFLIAIVVVAALAGLGWWQREWVLAKFYLGILEHEGRVRGLQIDRVIDVLELGPGDRVADIGAGTGVFSRPFARAVGEDGVVYAVDVNRELLSHIEETARQEGLSNLRTVTAGPADPMLPEPVDVIFICDTLHHIGEQPAYLRTLRRYLTPMGRVAVIDFEPDSSPHLGAKFTLEALRGWLDDAGFEPVASHEFVEDNFFVVYRCPSCPA